ncbi:hypothetical protein EP7_000447 [Isosphaeraceae bacterium EP7]
MFYNASFAGSKLPDIVLGIAKNMHGTTHLYVGSATLHGGLVGAATVSG